MGRICETGEFPVRNLKKSVVTLARPPTSSALKITDRSFCYALSSLNEDFWVCFRKALIRFLCWLVRWPLQTDRAYVMRESIREANPSDECGVVIRSEGSNGCYWSARSYRTYRSYRMARCNRSDGSARSYRSIRRTCPAWSAGRHWTKRTNWRSWSFRYSLIICYHTVRPALNFTARCCSLSFNVINVTCP